MTIITKDIKTVDELKTVIGQEKKAMVIYDVSTGAPNGLDVEVLININSSLAAIHTSLMELPTMDVSVAVAAAQLSETNAETAQEITEGFRDETEAFKNAAAAIVSGGPRMPPYANLTALNAANPDHQYTYLTSDNGHWNAWNGTAFESGGVYQTAADYILKSTIISDTDNWFNPDFILKDTIVDNGGSFASGAAGWDLIKIDLTEWVGEASIRIGNIKYYSRAMYYAFYSTNEPNGTEGLLTHGNVILNSTNNLIDTIAIPDGAKCFCADIKAPADSVDIYSECIVSKGSFLLSEYKGYDYAVREINGVKVYHETSNLNNLTADLPVSDGLDVAVGYAYINSVTGQITVKL